MPLVRIAAGGTNGGAWLAEPVSQIAPTNMSSSGSAPQEHLLGNFHAYYSFNPASERLRFMDADVSTALRQALLIERQSRADAAADDSESDKDAMVVLDVGCNEGDLTLGLYRDLVGMDMTASDETDVRNFDCASVSRLNEVCQKTRDSVDYIFTEDGASAHRQHFQCKLLVNGEIVAITEGVSKKIAKAKAASEALASLRKNEDDSKEDAPSDRQESSESAQECRTSIENDEDVNEGSAPGKRVFVLGVDIDAELIKRASTKVVSLRDGDILEFRHADVMEKQFKATLAAFSRRQSPGGVTPRRECDLITLFSVTMWIHLNHGDDGLWKFLESMAEMTDHLIVEPQPWKCYRNALKRLQRLRLEVPASFRSLQVREDVLDRISAFLLDAGRFRYKANLGRTNWARPIWLFSRTPIQGIPYDKA